MKALIAFALIASSWTQQTTYDLLWKPKVGQKLVYAISIDGKMMESAFQFASDVHLNVKKVEPNGDYTLGTIYKNTVAKLGGETQNLAEEPEELQRFNARGEPLDPEKADDEEDDAFGELVARAGDYYKPPKPVAVGDTWTHTFPADKKLGLPKATGKYTLVGLAEGKLKIAMEYREESGIEPTVAKGTAFVDPANGLLVSVQSELENARIQEGVPPAKAKLTLKLK